MQQNLFSGITSVIQVPNKNTENVLVPYLVSFRELVPEIVSTSYLTHSIYYYPAKFIVYLHQTDSIGFKTYKV